MIVYCQKHNIFALTRMLRILLFVSLISCLCSWVLSYWNVEYNSGFHALGLYHGAVELSNNRSTRGGTKWGGFEGFSTQWFPDIDVYYAGTYQVWDVYIPLWIPILLCIGLLWITEYPILLSTRRGKRGQCLKCGYNLCKSNGKCPECGTEFDPELLKKLQIKEPTEKQPT
ncbi:MAG: hypothetical protein HJJLKODD_02663 [Phycisphaerae bacterium]|nr:hypothetical protein [Phycisphaerae bacterium]